MGTKACAIKLYSSLEELEKHEGPAEKTVEQLITISPGKVSLLKAFGFVDINLSDKFQEKVSKIIGAVIDPEQPVTSGEIFSYQAWIDAEYNATFYKKKEEANES